MVEILTNIAEQGPLVGLLVAIVWYFLSREKAKEEQIERLHDEINDLSKENITLLIRISATLEKLTDKFK